MAKFTVEVEVTDAQIKKAVDSAGKFKSWEIEGIARTLVENKVKTKMRKSIGNLDALIDEAIALVDWKQIIIDRIAERGVYDD